MQFDGGDPGMWGWNLHETTDDADCFTSCNACSSLLPKFRDRGKTQHFDLQAVEFAQKSQVSSRRCEHRVAFRAYAWQKEDRLQSYHFNQKVNAETLAVLSIYGPGGRRWYHPETERETGLGGTRLSSSSGISTLRTLCREVGCPFHSQRLTALEAQVDDLKQQMEADRGHIQQQFEQVEEKLETVSTDLSLSLKAALDQQSKDLMHSFSKSVAATKQTKLPARARDPCLALRHTHLSEYTGIKS